MADPLIVIVFVAAGGAADATTRAMERATHDALGLEAHVDVHETAIVPSDLDVLITEQKAHASAVVELTWAEQGKQARLRVHVARSGRWISRSIGFVPSDADAERGRTIGFAVASMLPEGAPEPEEAPAQGSAPDLPDASAVALSPPATTAPGPTIAAVAAAPAAKAPELEGSYGTGAGRNASEPSLHGPARRFALDVCGFGTDSLDSNAQSVGGRAAGQWFVTPFASLGVGLGVDGGSLDAARGNFLTALLSGGLAFHPWWPTASRPYGLSVRSEYLLASQSLTSFGSTGPGTRTRSRLVSGVDLAVDARWRLTSTVDLLVGAGLEEFFARTDIERMGARAATLPAVRCFGEVGLGVRF